MSVNGLPIAVLQQQSSEEDLGMLLGDVLDVYHTNRKTGTLFVMVKQSSQFLVRFYFKYGEVYYVSYGPLKGAECLDLLGCYDFHKAVFMDGVKAPLVNEDLPETSKLISHMRKLGHKVTMDPLSQSSSFGRAPYAAPRQ